MNLGRSQPTHDPTSVIRVDYSKVECPSCKVSANRQCLTKRGNPATEAHAARIHLYYRMFPDHAPVWWNDPRPARTDGRAPDHAPTAAGLPLVQADAPVTLRADSVPAHRLKPPGMDLVELFPVLTPKPRAQTRIALRCLICNRKLDETVVLLADAVRVWTEHANTKERDL